MASEISGSIERLSTDLIRTSSSSPKWRLAASSLIEGSSIATDRRNRSASSSTMDCRSPSAMPLIVRPLSQHRAGAAGVAGTPAGERAEIDRQSGVAGQEPHGVGVVVGSRLDPLDQLGHEPPD